MTLYDELESREESARAADLDASVRDVVRHAWEHAPGWRRRLESAGVEPDAVTGVGDLPSVPVLSKDELREVQAREPLFGGFLAAPVEELACVFVSPGPIFDPQHGTEDIGGFARGLHAAGLRRGMLVLNTFAYHLTPAGRAFESGAQALGCSVIPAGVGNTDQQAEVLSRADVKGYVGTPSFLSILMERAPGWRFQHAAVAAEKMTEEDRRALESRGGTVRQLYGTADLGHLGAECSELHGMHVPEDKIIEVCDPITGEPVPDGDVGQVVVTTFSRTYPMLRLGTGDLSRYVPDDGTCACGRTSRRLDGVLGRIGAGVKVRAMFVYPHHVDMAIDGLDINAAQLVVDRDGPRDTVFLRVAGAAADADVAARAAARLREVAKIRAEPVVVALGDIADDAPRIDDRRPMWDA